MAAAPDFSVGDVVYMKSSAAIGRLDAFRINQIQQIQEGRWVYRIDIYKKPPHRQLIGDSYDGRTMEKSIYYTAEELITLCEALQMMVDGLTRQIAHVQSQLDGICDTPDPVVPDGDSKFNIGDRVFIDASARLGFFEAGIVLEIHPRPIQPGSKRYRYAYKLDLLGNRPRKDLYFRESEIITYCEAGTKIMESLNSQLDDVTAQQQNQCP